MNRRTRVLLRVAAVLVVVALLGWGAESLSRYGAQSLLGRDVRAATGVPMRPVAYVRSAPVLPQTLRGSYGEVAVRTEAITSGPLRIDRVDSVLTDVRMPFRDVLLQDLRRVGVGSSRETVTLTYSDVNAYLDRTGRSVVLTRADDGALRVTGAVNVLGQRVDAAADVELVVADGAVVVAPTRVTDGEEGLDSVQRLLLTQRLTLRIPLLTLPFGRQLTAVRADPDGVRVSVEGRAVILQP